MFHRAACCRAAASRGLFQIVRQISDYPRNFAAKLYFYERKLLPYISSLSQKPGVELQRVRKFVGDEEVFVPVLHSGDTQPEQSVVWQEAALFQNGGPLDYAGAFLAFALRGEGGEVAPHLTAFVMPFRLESCDFLVLVSDSSPYSHLLRECVFPLEEVSSEQRVSSDCAALAFQQQPA